MEGGQDVVARDRRIRPAVVAAVIAVGVLAVVLVLLRLSRITWLPESDWALIELGVRDVGSAHTPTLGVYSRYGWQHPGPLLFYVLAIPYRLLGSRSAGLLAGAFLVNAASITTIAVVAWRRGGAPLLAWAAVPTALLLRALGGQLLLDPWNPYLNVLPLAALVTLAWSAACGDGWALPVAVAVGSFVVQAHAGLAAEVALLVLVALVGLVVSGAGLRRTLPIALVVGLVLWLPPIVEALRHDGGNLRAIWDFTTSDRDHLGGRVARHLVSEPLGIWPQWVQGVTRVALLGIPDVRGTTFPFAAVLTAVVGGFAVWRRRWDAVWLCGIALAVAVVAVLSVSRIVDLPFVYLVRWLAVVGWAAWLAIGAGVLALVRTPAPRSRPGIAVAAVAWSAIAVVTLVAVLGTSVYQERFTRRMQALAPAVVDLARRGCAPFLVSTMPTTEAEFAMNGLVLQVDRAGLDVRVPVGRDASYGAHRALGGRGARCAVYVGSGPGAAAWKGTPDLVSYYDPLTPAQRATYERLEPRVGAALRRYAADPSAANEQRFAAANARLQRIVGDLGGVVGPVGVIRTTPAQPDHPATAP